MLKPLDINQTTFDALNNAATVVYEAVYEAAYEAVSDAVSEVDASHFHELSRNSINLKWRLHYSLKIKTVKVKMSSAWFSYYNPRKSFKVISFSFTTHGCLATLLNITIIIIILIAIIM